MSVYSQPVNRTDDITVLHVDDDSSVIELTGEMLERAAETIDHVGATSGEECLTLLSELSIDCIVSDYNMPGLDGLDLLAEVRAEYPELPFILFTGRGSEEIASEAISSGVTDYIQKGGTSDVYDVLANRIDHAVSRYRSRQALKDQKESLIRAQRIADLGNWDWDIVHGHLYWSDQVYRIFGVDPASFESTYEAFLDFVHPDDREKVQRNVDAALESGEPYSIDHRIVRADAETRIVHEHGEVIRDESGEPIAMNGTVQDITDRVERRRDLEAFRNAVEYSGHSIYWTDSDGTIQYVNPMFETSTGYEAEEAIGRTPAILKSGVHDASFYQELWDTITAGEVWQAEVVNQRKNGEPYVVEQTIAPITDTTGEIERYVAVNAEITELKEQRTALERERDRFASLFEAIPEPVVHIEFVDDEAIVREINQPFGETFGLEESDAIGEPINDLIVPSDVRPEANAIDAAANDGRTITRRVTRHTADGSRDFLLRSVPCGLDSDRPEHFGIYVDISEETSSRRAIEQRMERLDEFASTVSHDLRNPLNVIKSRVELANEECDSDHLDRADEAIDRMESMIDQTLRLARDGKVVGETESVAVDEVVTASWATVETGVAEVVIEKPFTVEADPDRLRHLFENLFRNAVTHGGRNVTVTVGEMSSGFFVEDDGRGIPVEDRDRIFEMTYSTADDPGLGLALVKRIAEAHGWTVAVAESDTGGARFEFQG